MCRISIIIATFNRSRLLEQALRSFEALQPPEPDAWEIIIVDNNSTDDTPRVVEALSALLPLRYVLEPSQGSSFARNRGLDEARGEYAVYVDDDVLVDPPWLVELRRAMEAHPECSFFGGRITPRFEDDPPRWFSTSAESPLAGLTGRHDFGDEPRWYPIDGTLPFGANMAVRVDVLRRAGGFNTAFGPKAGGRIAGGETELLKRLVAAGEKGLYVPTAAVQHVVTGRMMTRRYAMRYFAGHGAAAAARGEFDDPARRMAGVPLWVLNQMGREAVKAVRSLWSPAGARALSRLGFWRGAVRAIRRRRRDSRGSSAE